jgi:hypothetical protein
LPSCPHAWSAWKPAAARRVAGDHLEQQQQQRGADEADQGRQQQRVALLQSTPEVPSRPRIRALATPTPMIEPIRVCEEDAGSPKYQVPRFHRIAAINSANTMAKPALEPTCRISSTGNSLRRGAALLRGARCNKMDARQNGGQGDGRGRAPRSAGASRAARRAYLMGTSWREQDAPIPAECNNIVEQFKVVHRFITSLPHTRTSVSEIGSRYSRPRAPIFAAQPRRSSDRRQNACTPVPWHPRQAIGGDRTGAPSPAP